MAKKDKLIERFLQNPKDFSWAELVRLLKGFGYQEVTLGKTGGSRRRFVHETLPTITLHKPHPKDILKSYQLKQIRELLEQEDVV